MDIIYFTSCPGNYCSKIGTMSKQKVFKDNTKSAEQKEDDKALVVHIAENLLGEILKNPSAWNDPLLNNVKSMVRRIGTDTVTYPLPPWEDDTTLHDSSATPELTKSIGTAVFNRESVNLSDFKIQITASTPAMVTTKLAGNAAKGLLSGDIHHRMWKLNAIDGDETIITVRLDSTLNSEGTLLEPGTVIHVTSAFPVYMTYGNMYDKRCAIVLREFRILCRRPVPSSFTGPPEKRLKVKEVDTQQLDEDDESEDVSSGACSGPACSGPGCTGQLCSKHGIDFSACILKCVPIGSVSLSRVAKECVFVTKELKHMDNKNKRFLLYYYYATSVYQFHGKGNRVELPNCLVSAVRETYPDDEKKKGNK